MNLHNTSIFKEIINEISHSTSIEESIIEKDYYVTLLLKELLYLDSNFIFKGGTSLSKCYHIIQRFSEDIDINYHPNISLTQGKKKEIKKTVETAVSNCKLEIINIENTRSKRAFNQYIISYPNLFFINAALKDKVILETAFQLPSFPFETKQIQSLIGEYLLSIDKKDLVTKYRLESFPIHVQCLERTFIDKIFALCDYYLLNKFTNILDTCMIYIKFFLLSVLTIPFIFI